MEDFKKLTDIDLEKLKHDIEIELYKRKHFNFLKYKYVVKSLTELLTLEEDLRKIYPYYTCYNGQLVFVQDEKKLYMLKDETNTKSMLSWEIFGKIINMEEL